ncbi:MAG: hypothetical protein LBK73_04660 [Treponema sp.]|nr:hypothetical protein [Treponema sp.]
MSYIINEALHDNKPIVRNHICINSHSIGCGMAVKRQIASVKTRFSKNSENLKSQKAASPEAAPAVALVIGCSTGYGLASRIATHYEPPRPCRI